MFTDSPSASSQSAATASLCGIVTFAPAKPSATSPATACSSPSGATSSGTYAQSSARAAKAAFCIRGESEPGDRLAEQPDEPRAAADHR